MMPRIKKRQDLKICQAKLLDDIGKSLEGALECQELHTKILEKNANKRQKHKVTSMAKAKGSKPIMALVADVGDKVFNMARDELGKINGTTFEVTKATSYDQVFSAIQSRRFDVILVDCQSFTQDEEQTSNIIMASRKIKKHVPIIAYGPEDSHECDMMAMEAGAADYLNKDKMTAKMLEKSIRYCLCRS